MSGKKKILIVDDIEENCAYIRTIANTEGYDSVSALDGVEAMAAAREHKPDLVILDLMMPNKGGDFVIRELKKDPALKEIPVIVCTGASEVLGVDVKTGDAQVVVDYSEQVDRAEGQRYHKRLKRYSYDDFIEKPIEPDVLTEKIRKLIPA